ncbi:BMP family ABC transporter substrate-binding protein [Caproiciproducens sp. NJN-50]|uniref:BMP family ABC transporter substrate-binding protein n=1 Tax=Acutalibacteraceae TaxID=3082771 RepID=UPI000FFE0BF2|nr:MULTISPECIES: BMP family ABC transporter substrate-binding protein [Acutalibacteraceae]QAT50505.1 BMP family ABC transporter substrate-binding protein [Caproiciproducens sp. NJN-50]
MKKLAAFLLAALMAVSATACGSGAASSSEASSQAASGAGSSSEAAAKEYKVLMVTDTGGVNDQSFNQLSWEGLQQLAKDVPGVKPNYSESKQESDYGTNLDKAADDGNQLIWGVGFAMADALENAAKQNPDISYAIIDNAYTEVPSNVTCVVFRAQEPSFLVGYIAGKTTKANKVGFVGGQKSDVIDQFEYGYKAGVEYAAHELNKKIEVVSQYAESFVDSAKGKAIAKSMYSGGCDIVFHAAGNVGVGVIEAAKEANKYAIGVDKDQAFLAPSNVLTSAMKRVDKAVEQVSKDAINGTAIGGKTYSLGLTEDGVGIPEEHKLMGDDTYNATIALEQKIKDKTIVPPASKDDYDAFVKALK